MEAKAPQLRQATAMKTILLAALMATPMAVGTASQSPDTLPKEEICTVDVYGDSLLLPVETVMQAVSKDLPNLYLINNSVEFLSLNDLVVGFVAKNTDKGTVAMPSFPRASRKGKIAVIELGSIDALLGFDKEIFREQLEYVLEILHKEGRTAILVGVSQSTSFTSKEGHFDDKEQLDEFNMAMHDVAASKGVAFVQALNIPKDKVARDLREAVITACKAGH